MVLHNFCIFCFPFHSLPLCLFFLPGSSLQFPVWALPATYLALPLSWPGNWCKAKSSSPYICVLQTTEIAKLGKDLFPWCNHSHHMGTDHFYCVLGGGLEQQRLQIFVAWLFPQLQPSEVVVVNNGERKVCNCALLLPNIFLPLMETFHVKMDATFTIEFHLKSWKILNGLIWSQFLRIRKPISANKKLAPANNFFN